MIDHLKTEMNRRFGVAPADVRVVQCALSDMSARRAY